jgi:hypothetical protein
VSRSKIEKPIGEPMTARMRRGNLATALRPCFEGDARQAAEPGENARLSRLVDPSARADAAKFAAFDAAFIESRADAVNTEPKLWTDAGREACPSCGGRPGDANDLLVARLGAA